MFPELGGGWFRNTQTPLMLAEKNSHLPVISLLLEKMIHQGIVIPDTLDIHKTGKEGATLLISAAKIGSVEVVKLCLERGAEVDQSMEDGLTALMSAALSGHVDVVRTLLENGAKVDLRNTHGDTALHIAISNGYTEMEDILEQYGANRCAAYQELMDRELAEELTLMDIVNSTEGSP